MQKFLIHCIFKRLKNKPLFLKSCVDEFEMMSVSCFDKDKNLYQMKNSEGGRWEEDGESEIASKRCIPPFLVEFLLFPPPISFSAETFPLKAFSIFRNIAVSLVWDGEASLTENQFNGQYSINGCYRYRLKCSRQW